MRNEAITCEGRTGRRQRLPLDPRRERALLGAMRGALRRSVVLLPLSEDDDRLQDFVAAALGGAA
jgi:hypothetical protein